MISYATALYGQCAISGSDSGAVPDASTKPVPVNSLGGGEIVFDGAVCNLLAEPIPHAASRSGKP